MPMMSRCLSVKAEIAIGTSCRFWERFSAVTTSSSMVLVVVAAAAAVVARRVWAWATPPAKVASSALLNIK